VSHWAGDRKSERSMFGKREEREAGQAIGVGRELAGLRTRGVDGSRETEGTGEISRDAGGRISKEERDVTTGGRTDEGGSETIT